MAKPELDQAMDQLSIGVAICDRENFFFLDANTLIRQWFDLGDNPAPFPSFLIEADQKRFFKAIEKKRVFRYKGTYRVNARETTVEFQVKEVQLKGSDPVLLIQGIVNEAEQQTQLLIKSHDAMLARTNALLVGEKEKVEEANRVKSSFLATMSHELKTPLNAIIGFVHVLSKRLDNENHLKLVDKVSRASKSLALIVEDILQVADMDSNNKDVICAARTETQSIIDAANNYYALLKSKKEIEFHSNISPDLPEYIFIDGKRLKQAAFHLLSNAHKFTSSGRIGIEIDLADDGGSIIVCVTDTGIGISEDFKSEMYKSFTQEDDSSTRRYGGTGIGLSICYSTAKYMGGKITCFSEKGVGTRMVLELPFDNTDQCSLY